MASLLTADLRIVGEKDALPARVLFDTGASHSFVTRALADRLATTIRLPAPLRFTLGDGRTLEVTDTVLLSVQIGGQMVTDNFMVLPGAGLEDVILGASTMRKYSLKIDMERSAVYAEIKETVDSAEVHSSSPALHAPLSTIHSDRKEPRMNDTLKALFAKLNLTVAEATTDEQAIDLIVQEVGATHAAPLAAPAILAALGLAETATEAEVKGKIMALQHRADVVPAEQFAALKAEMHKRDITDTVDGGLREGKLTPAERDWATGEATKDLPAFKAFLAHRPKVVPLGTTLPEAAATKAAQLDDVQAQVNRQLGVSAEVFAKYSQQ